MSKYHPGLWFRHGDPADAGNNYRTLATAPTLVTHGVRVPPDRREYTSKLAIRSTAAGAHSFTIVLWGYRPNAWIYVAGTLTEIANTAGWCDLGVINVVGSGAANLESHRISALSGYLSIAAQSTTLVGAPSIWTDFSFSFSEE